ncbi:DUF3795 domain-containing protein [Candidatus Korarchaeum cryptofilum]|uniref:Uncharacterized protein n=1 Tax=Korarchaeum cryptofilum (strain OPF8) TaxID=374847 RepID=B1L4R5_KORCO|nr:DUF3795 domain-containing protein [Candidatus Korarchaeum cryptofilum]ACB07444.1 hypothetical protein Kcr_0693 [Candidatus Korarchaeum cryptofilum OPF8]
MKQIKEGLERFLRRKGSLKRRKRCVEKRGIKGCDECKQWPCELLRGQFSSLWTWRSLKSSWRKSRNVDEAPQELLRRIFTEI